MYDDKFSEKRYEIQRARDRDLERIDEDHEMFNRYLDAFNTYPIVLYDLTDQNLLWSKYQINLSKILADRCKAKGWLFVDAYRYGSFQNSIRMVVPRNRKTPKLVSNLMLLNDGTNAHVGIYTKSRSWQFDFAGADGQKLYDAWIENCKQDVVSQMVLGFGPGENGEYNYDMGEDQLL